MNEQEQRIAIAEACGWTYRVDDIGFTHWKHPSYGTETIHPAIPDYLHDLNAMHEAENWLEANLTNRCLDYAVNLVGVINPKGFVGQFRLLNATVTQRSEAFLRTIGKWKEDEP